VYINDTAEFSILSGLRCSNAPFCMKKA
jgi:hypothetical protein